MTKRKMEKWRQKVPFNLVVLLKQNSNQKFWIHCIEDHINTTNEFKNTAQKLLKVRGKYDTENQALCDLWDNIKQPHLHVIES